MNVKLVGKQKTVKFCKKSFSTCKVCTTCSTNYINQSEGTGYVRSQEIDLNIIKRLPTLCNIYKGHTNVEMKTILHAVNNMMFLG